VDPRTKFADNVEAQRREAGLTQEKVALESGLALSEISRIESGNRDVRLTTIVKVAKGLGVPAGDLLEGLP